MDTMTLFKSLKIAMEKEYEAEKFYLNFASKIKDEELKKLIEDFAAEGGIHFNKLT